MSETDAGPGELVIGVDAVTHTHFTFHMASGTL
jgi:hypothetical protein